MLLLQTRDGHVCAGCAAGPGLCQSGHEFKFKLVNLKDVSIRSRASICTTDTCLGSARRTGWKAETEACGGGSFGC